MAHGDNLAIGEYQMYARCHPPCDRDMRSGQEFAAFCFATAVPFGLASKHGQGSDDELFVTDEHCLAVGVYLFHEMLGAEGLKCNRSLRLDDFSR